MSKEFLESVFSQIARVTNVLVETAKLKDSLENDSCELKQLINQAKEQVDQLYEKSQKLHKFFNDYLEENAIPLNSIDNDTNAASDQTTTNNVNNSENEPEEAPDTTNIEKNVKVESDRPTIKLVDINKLVEPKSIIKKDLGSPIKAKKTVQFVDTIVLSSSNDEEEEQISKARKSPRIRQHNSKNEASFRKLTLRKESISKVMNSKKINNSVKTNLSDTSDDDSSSDMEEIPRRRIRQIKPKSKKTTSVESAEIDKNDIKFKLPCEVRLLRIPCEKLKDYYNDVNENLEIKRLTNLKSTIKTTHREGNENVVNGKSSAKQRSDKDQSSESDSSVSNNSEVDDTIDENEHANVDDSFAERDREESAEVALAMLNSDDDLEESNSDKEMVDTGKNEADNEKTSKKSKTKKELNNSVKKPEKKAKNKFSSSSESENSDTDSRQTSKKKHNSKSQSAKKLKENNDAGKNKLSSDDSEIENGQDKRIEVDQSKTSDSSANEEENEPSDTKKTASDSLEAEEDTDKLKNDGENEAKSETDDETSTNSKSLTKKKNALISDSDDELEENKKNNDKAKDSDGSDAKNDDSPTSKKSKTKKRKKKALISDSDSDKKDSDPEGKESENESSSASEKEEEKPKRKRVKRVAESSDEEGGKSTRKQIRKVWGKDSLAETTKQAEAEERERKARIAEKQKKYNQIYEDDVQLNATVDKVVLDFDEETKAEVLKVDKTLASKLKPHQASGIQFMWDACFESVKRAKTTKGSGCILAHCMGLGKTLQVIALTHTLITNSDKTNVKTVLVACPINTILNWKAEYKTWQKGLKQQVEVYELTSAKQNSQRCATLSRWQRTGGVLIIGYTMFRNLTNVENKRIRKFKTTFTESLIDPGPDLVVCDEGHLLKNEKSFISVAMCKLRTMRRIVLTGTPLQNNMKEYFCMVQFIKPNLLGTYKEYLNRFVNPIINGQYTDSTPHDIQIMRKRSHVLHKMLDGVVQRRDYSVLQPYLPPKHEYVLFLTLTKTQVQLYQHYMDHFARMPTEGRNTFLFVDFQALQRICTHPKVLVDAANNAARKYNSDDDSEGSLKDFIDDGTDEEESSSSSDSSGSEKSSSGKSNVKKGRITRARAAEGDLVEGDESMDISAGDKHWWQQYCDGDELNNLELSSKIYLLFEILKECEQIGDKLLVFSQSLYSLNVIEYFLERVHEATQADKLETVNGFSGSWILGLDYFRLDGSSSCDNRSMWCNSFNNPTNNRARLFLISTKAGGLGINLVAANRVIIFDVSWNPSHDIQSIYRVYRFGQTKPSYIYRFVTYGTMEMKVYERQVTKQAISKRVIDEQQIDRHYNQNDLQELYKFEANPGTRPIPLVPKDVLLGELLQKFEDRIYKYHEHQSLLENKEEESLNEEERKAAWEEFENEKKQRPVYAAAGNIADFSQMGGPGQNYRPQIDPNLSTAMINVIMRENPTYTMHEVKNVLPAFYMQLQHQITKGDLSFYTKIQQEMRVIQALQNQQLKQYYQQQQAMKTLQEQQKLAMATNQNFSGYNPALFEMMKQLPGTSSSQSTPISNEVIELND